MHIFKRIQRSKWPQRTDKSGENHACAVQMHRNFQYAGEINKPRIRCRDAKAARSTSKLKLRSRYIPHKYFSAAAVSTGKRGSTAPPRIGSTIGKTNNNTFIFSPRSPLFLYNFFYNIFQRMNQRFIEEFQAKAPTPQNHHRMTIFQSSFTRSSFSGLS